jgi:hypothetical protein
MRPKIVADTMDNYLMYGHIVKCKFVPKEQLHPEIWKFNEGVVLGAAGEAVARETELGNFPELGEVSLHLRKNGPPEEPGTVYIG